MPEPTSSVAVSLAAGVGAFIVTSIGVQPQPLFWALIGATLGLSLAAEAGRLRAVSVFVAVIFASALIGSWAAHHVDATDFGRNGLSLVVAALFHPIFSAAIAQVPAVVASIGAWFANRRGGAQP